MNIKKAKDIVLEMSLREKIGQLNQAGTTTASVLPGVEVDIEHWVSEMLEGRLSQSEFEKRMEMCKESFREDEIENGELGAFVNFYNDKKIFDVQNIALQKSRLKIPLLIGVDVIRGYRTIFPTPLALSCSWDLELIKATTVVSKKEALVSGVNWVLGPMIDVARDARWGRVVETYGEDPYLISQIAKTQIEVFQNEDNGGKLLATAKHFVAYGAVSGGQDYNTVSISKNQLYNVHLLPFKAAVDSNVAAVMSAFHDVEGVPCTMSKWLLTDVLRGELGFKGFVVSDAEAVKQCVVHGVATDERDAARQSLLAGGDMDMSSQDYVKHLEDLVECGEISEEIINTSVVRVLEKKIEYGLFQREYKYNHKEIENTVLCKQHREIALEAAKKSAVLLKNNNVLPINNDVKNILILGDLANDREALMGPWAFTGNKENLVTIVDGMRNLAPNGVKIKHVKAFGPNRKDFDFEQAMHSAEKADFILAIAGETAFMSGEASSRADLNLEGKQEEFLCELAQINKPIAVVVVGGRPNTIGALNNNWKIGAILQGWHLGLEFGNAIAQIVYGMYNPSGKLTMTFANNVGQQPMFYNHVNTGKPAGDFKFTSKYQDAPIKPLYPFGYGLSYTTFTYNNLKISNNKLSVNDILKCKVNVKNSGNFDGEEIVQLYVKDNVTSCTRPVKELKAFSKIFLKAGEEKTCELEVSVSNLGFYNGQCEYVVETGEFTLFVGTNSENCLIEQFTVI